MNAVTVNKTKEETISKRIASQPSGASMKTTSKAKKTNQIKLNVYIQNAHSIRDKVDEIRLATKSCPFQIIIFTETWLSRSINNIEHFGNRYNVFRGDRTELTSDRIDGGGVLVAVDCNFSSEQIVLVENSGLEYVCVKIAFESCNVFVFAVYIRSVHETAKFVEFAEIVRLITLGENDVVIVCGDFNQPGVKWIKADDGDYFLPMNVSTEGGIAMFDSMFDCGYHQLSNIKNAAGNVLDLVFTNNYYEFSLIESVRPLIKSDMWHKAIEIEMTIEGIEPSATRPSSIYAYNSADFDSMNQFLIENATLCGINRIDDLGNAFHLFGNVLHEAMDLFVPKVTVERSTDPPWYTKQLKHAKNVRNKAYKRARETGNFDEYNTVTDLFMEMQGQLFKSYVSRILSQIKANPKLFWRFVNNRRKRGETPASIEYNDVKANTEASIAELFADFFENQYTQSENIELEQLLDGCSENSLAIEIYEDDVLKALLSLNVNKGAGPDGFSPKLMKNCAHALSKPLTMLFQRSLDQGFVPAVLKNSRVVPIFKSGKKGSATNYRPVVIIPTIAKVFEIVIHNKISAFVNSKIVHNQHGFVKNRSTTTNLLQMVNFTMDAMIEKYQIDVLYTDFLKAFDRVNLRLLLKKLVKFGFSRQLVKWFHAYLTSRTQYVVIGDKKSRTFNVSSGVPAGSILGPCLFIIFINDIVQTVSNALVLLFADDLKLLRRVSSPMDAIAFQHAIDQLDEWCTRNQLYLNLKKCYIMTYSKNTTGPQYEYTFNGGNHTFERVEQHRDLGVIFDTRLTFTSHIDTIISAARIAMGFIKRTLKNKFTIDSAKILYCTLVRSKLEYASIVWQPYHRIHIDRIESIQKNFVMYALRNVFVRDENFVLPSYLFRCKVLNIQPLWRRRVNASIFLIYDLLLGNIVSNDLRERIVYTRQQYNVNQRNLRNTDLIRIRTYTSDYAHNQPFNVACRYFNLTREQFFESPSRQVFRDEVIRIEHLI